MSAMHVGYFADFDSRDTILIEADAEALRELGETLGSLASGRIKRLVLHRLPFVQVHGAIELRALCGEQDRGARRDGPGNSFLWERSRTGWRTVAEQLVVLAGASQPCHHDLDAEQNDVVVSVSNGEYGDTWWARHG